MAVGCTLAIYYLTVEEGMESYQTEQRFKDLERWAGRLEKPGTWASLTVMSP